MRAALLPVCLLLACTDKPEETPPEPIGPGLPNAAYADDGSLIFGTLDHALPWRGPGAVEQAWPEDALWQHCAYLDGGERDFDHHNLVVPYRGHLVMPWSPEFGTGGVSLFDLSDPCAPVKVGEGTASEIGAPWGVLRETHAIGFAILPDDDPHAGEYMVVNMMMRGLTGPTGIQIWDVSDLNNPTPISGVTLSGAFYPDSYGLVTLSLFVQFPYVYTASANAGVHVVDMSDPYNPVEVGQYSFPQGMRTGGVFALGTHLFVSSAEERQAAVLDISDPVSPQLFPGGLFDLLDEQGVAVEAYHANLTGPYALFARKERGGGPIIYDISDPSNPTRISGDPLSGSGGYVFYDEGYLFTGDSSVSHVTDARDIHNPTMLGQIHLGGDLDTLVPWGNVAIAAVDDLGDEGTPGQATAVVPWSSALDTNAPQLMRTVPEDGATGVARTARIGLGFNEMIEPSSAFAGSIRLWTNDGEPVPGWTSAQETIAHFAPKQPLEPNTTYTAELLADGVSDIHGNRVSEAHTWTFTTSL